MRPAITLLAVLAATPAAAQTDRAERRAFRLSLLGTVIPVAAGATWWVAQGPTDILSSGPGRMGPAGLIAVGLIVGPSLGYPAALGGRALRGARIRTGLTLVSVLPAYAICGWNCSKGDPEYDLAWLTIATGTGLSLASAVYDISRLKHNLRRHDETHRGLTFSAAPVYLPGQRALGVRLGVSF